MRKTMTLAAVLLTSLMLGLSSAYAAKPDNKSNNGSNGCERSNSRSSACDKNPNTNQVLVCVIWTQYEVRHPETGEPAFNFDDGWQLGDTAVFSDGATCLVAEDPPGGR